jgi:hypothetical protein
MDIDDNTLGPELKAWHILLEDCTYRLDHPDDYHTTLLARADELLNQGVIDREQWRGLRELADAAYANCVEGPAGEVIHG